MAASERPDLTAALAEIDTRLRARRPRDALALLVGLDSAVADGSAALARRAWASALVGEIAASLAAARRVLADPSADLAALNLAGNSLTHAQAPAEAHEAFRRAAALAPDHTLIQLNLAATARFLGRMDEAEDAYAAVIRGDPTVWEAYRARAEVRRQTPERNHIEELRDRLRTLRPPPEGEVQLCYALGKEYEDLEDHERAFAWFDRGARLRRARMRYDVAEDVAALRQIESVFDQAYCAPARLAEPGDGPIFILGLPRTGSTLLERMLGRHSRVQPLGELQSFAMALVQTLRVQGGRPPAPGKLGAIEASAALVPAEVGAAYLRAVAPLRDARPRFTDKLPINMLYAALIARALPAARIVHLTRDPADACLAIYKTLFDEAYPYSYDLRELAAYHNAYRRLAAHWRAALGPRFIELAYEDLVADPAAALTDLMGRLELDLESACLRPEREEAPVMTASASQVRAPVHARSVGLYRRYGAALAPLLAALSEGPA